MKKISAMLLVIAMLAGLMSACAPKQTPAADSAQLQEQPAVIGETVPEVPEEAPEEVELSNVQAASDRLDIEDLIAQAQATPEGSDDQITVQVGGGSSAPADKSDPAPAEGPTGEYHAGVVLIKSETTPDMAVLQDTGVVSVEPLYPGAKWYSAKLQDTQNTEEAVNALRSLECFDAVDYDYVMGIDDVSSVDVTTNPDFEKSKHFGPHGIQQGWKHINDHGRHPGGSSDVIVAVIDTGVDYNHVDLRNNIWVNIGEIPGNGIDDDGNGYIDDVNGWNCVGDNNDPMDDNGHGTHVAGIIAAENNDVGGVGVAYNCKIMPIKAGNSSGYFNSSDIAEAVQYAYMNGASVINMSFGGSSISIPVQDTLESAYTTCILVAAAGNDGLCNEPSCKEHLLKTTTYPAALPYVIGVMSVSNDGSAVSGFSNFDHFPYSPIEYEVYAVGETIPSTWPGNKYATLQGTSMAAPSVSGIAALLRSFYADRETYPTKFIQSQIVNTGTIHPYNAGVEDVDGAHAVANIYEALTKLPRPEVNLYDYYIDDSQDVNPANNNDGVMDAGETVRLYISLHNRGGLATNVQATIDANRGEGVSDPYFTFPTDTITLPDIGTYSVCESGEQYFEIKIAKNCPNEYLTDFNIRFTYENGLDEEDTTVYTDDGRQQAKFDVRNGVVLKGQITEDTVLTKDNYYIIPTSLYIPEGVTVTVEPGTKLQFWSSDAKDEYAETGIAVINVAGKFITKGSVDEPVELFPSDHMGKFQVEINLTDNGYAELNYTTVTNARITVSKVDHCTFLQNYEGSLSYKYLSGGVVQTSNNQEPLLKCATTVTNSIFYQVSAQDYNNDYGFHVEADCQGCIFVDSKVVFGSYYSYTDCVFLGNNYQYLNGKVQPSNMTVTKALMGRLIDNNYHLLYDEETGTTYFRIYLPNYEESSLSRANRDYFDAFAKALGGHIAILETQAELDLIVKLFDIINYEPAVDLPNGSTQWPNGEPVEGLTVIPGNGEYPVILEDGTLSYDHSKTGNGYSEFILLEIPGSIYLDSLTLKEAAVTVDDETAYQIQVAQVLPAAFDTSTLIYVSGDPSVVTVSETGLVTPLRAGKATVYVYSPDYIAMAACKVTVTEKIPATAVTLEDAVVAAGSTLSLKPTVLPANTTEQVRFAVSDPEIASISGSELIAHKPGTVTVTATVGSVSATCSIRVTQAAEAITFADTFYLTYLEDTRIDWQPVIASANATDVEITYRSSDPEIAYVDENGQLMRVAPGNATIRASVSGTDLYDEIIVNVSETPIDPTVEVMQMASYGGFTFALLSDNTLWGWGGKHHTPVKLAEEIRSIGTYNYTGDTCLFIVNTAGELYQYSYALAYVTDLTQELGIKSDVLLTDVRKIVSSGDSGLFAIRNDGMVCAMGRGHFVGDGSGTDSRMTFVQTMISDVKDIAFENNGVYFLCDNGELYTCGYKNTTYIPVKVLDGVKEIARSDGYAVIYTEDCIYRGANCQVTEIEIGGAYYCSYIVDGTAYLYASYYKTNYGTTSFRYTASELSASKVFGFGSHAFVQTTDGKLYGYGSNSQYYLGDSTNINREIPTRIFFGISGGELMPAVESTNLQENVLTEQKLTLRFNTDMKESTNYKSIKMTDSQGMSVAITREHLMETYTVTPFMPFVNGEVYTLTVPADAFTTAFGVANEAITYTFTYQNNTPIAFVSATLADGAVLTEQAFSASFAYTMAKEGDSFAQIAVTKDGETVSGITAALADNTLTLSGTLDYGAYSLTIPAGALADNVGGFNEELVLAFSVVKPMEYTCSITDGQCRVDERADITVTFTDAMTAAALDTVTLTGADGSAVPVEATLEETVLTIHNEGLQQGAEYILTVPAGAVTDSLGTGNDPITLHFSTYFPVALAYASVHDGAEQLALEGSFKLYYNDSVYTLDDSKLGLIGPEGDVEITVTQEGKLVTVTPNEALTANTVYTLTAAEGAMTDERGAVSDAFTAAFTTIPVAERFFWDEESFNEARTELLKQGIGHFSGNAILNNLNDTNVEHWLRVTAEEGYSATDLIGVAGNYWGTTDEEMIQRQIMDFDDFQNLADIVLGSYLETAPANTFPFVTSVRMYNADGESVSKVSHETVKFVVRFNRDMDTTQPLSLCFGSVAPYADYQVSGQYVNARQWEGTYTIKCAVEGGIQKLNISGGRAASDHYLKLYDTVGRFAFEIDSSAALAMNLFAEPTDAGIKLTWKQDDYDTLMGYNIYRSTDKDGNFVKINPTLLLTTDDGFLDTNAEPGKTYWYTFTVVLSDFSESIPAGKISATALDTSAPNAYHTPVNQAYAGNNLVISCTASDNIGIDRVVLYYRTVGDTAWKSLTMNKVNSKFSATIFGSEVTMAGLEYYIEVTDGRNIISKATADAPYSVVVKDPSTLSRLGDVDGNNTITTKDALMIVQAINGDLLLSDDQFQRADLNKDGVLNSMEALRILQYINGKVNTLEM